MLSARYLASLDDPARSQDLSRTPAEEMRRHELQDTEEDRAVALLRSLGYHVDPPQWPNVSDEELEAEGYDPHEVRAENARLSDPYDSWAQEQRIEW